MGVGALAERLFGSLSSGERQRVRASSTRCCSPDDVVPSRARRGARPPSARGSASPRPRRRRCSGATTAPSPHSAPSSPRRGNAALGAGRRRTTPRGSRSAVAGRARRSPRGARRARRPCRWRGARTARRCARSSSSPSRWRRAPTSAGRARPSSRSGRGSSLRRATKLTPRQIEQRFTVGPGAAADDDRAARRRQLAARGVDVRAPVGPDRGVDPSCHQQVLEAPHAGGRRAPSRPTRSRVERDQVDVGGERQGRQQGRQLVGVDGRSFTPSMSAHSKLRRRPLASR